MKSSKADTSTYFIPGNIVLIADDEQKPHLKAQKDIEGGRFLHNGLATNYYVSCATGPERMIIVGFSGANAQFPVNPPEIKYLNDAGATLICMALPRVGPDFMKRSEALARAFITSQRSPANFLISSDVPQFIVTHSSSGPIITKLLGEPDTGRKIRSRFQDIGMLSPIWDVAYASRHYSLGINPIQIGPVVTPALRTKEINIGPITIPSFGIDAQKIEAITTPAFRPLRKIFEWYADKNAKVPFSDLAIVREYIRWTTKNERQGEEKYFEQSALRKMTMGNIRHIQEYAREVSDNFKPEHTANTRILMMTGDADACTCWKTNQAMARKMGAEFRLIAGGGHDLLKKQPQLLDIFLEKAEERIAMREKVKAEIYNDLPPNKAKEEIVPLPPLPLGNRLRDSARFALQGGTRFLNATASFF